MAQPYISASISASTSGRPTVGGVILVGRCVCGNILLPNVVVEPTSTALLLN